MLGTHEKAKVYIRMRDPVKSCYEIKKRLHNGKCVKSAYIIG